MNVDRYLFRRQFIYGPGKTEKFHHWCHSELPDSCFISVHPELSCIVAKRNSDFIVLLGYILDPFNPYRSNSNIAADMLKNCNKIQDLFGYLEPMGGRYAILACLKNNKIMLNDPTGFRQIFYMKDKAGKLWAASQTSLLSEIFGLSLDKELEKDLYSLPIFVRTNEYWYPGELTAFRDVRHLLPNHYLDLNSFRQIRFWPPSRISGQKVEDCVEKCSQILGGLYRGIEKRYKIAQTVTAGLDSRIVLAASRHMGEKINYLTYTNNSLSNNRADIVVLIRMLQALGLEHKILFREDTMDKEFERIYRQNVTTARFEHGLNAYSLYLYFMEQGKEMVLINGVCGEITRSIYHLPVMISINSRSLCALSGMNGSLLALEQFENWIKKSKDVCDESGISLLDLFYWEQRVGSWAAMYYGEYDIAFESFSPMNCRLLLKNMLGVKDKFRSEPYYILHKQLIRKMWSETLKFDINPSQKLSDKILINLKRTPLHGIIKTIKYLKYCSLFEK